MSDNTPLRPATQTPTTSILDAGLAQLHADLAALPAGVDKQLVTVIDERGMRAGFAARIGDDWTISAEVEQRWRRQRPGARLVIGKSW